MKMNEIENPIKSITVTLDGGWDKKPKNYGVDKSVIGLQATKFTGQVQKTFPDIESAIKWVGTPKHYPQFVNYSCGLHIDLELTDQDLLKQLYNKRFYKIFRTNATEWGKENRIKKGSQFWKRMKGDNNYCQVGFSSKERYKHLNFTDKNLNVVQCRVFPTFQKIKLTQSAVDFFYNLVRNYLGLRRLVN